MKVTPFFAQILFKDVHAIRHCLTYTFFHKTHLKYVAKHCMTCLYKSVKHISFYILCQRPSTPVLENAMFQELSEKETATSINPQTLNAKPRAKPTAKRNAPHIPTGGVSSSTITTHACVTAAALGVGGRRLLRHVQLAHLRRVAGAQVPVF